MTGQAAAPIPEAYKGWNMPRFFYANLKYLLSSTARRAAVERLRRTRLGRE